MVNTASVAGFNAAAPTCRAVFDDQICRVASEALEHGPEGTTVGVGAPVPRTDRTNCACGTGRSIWRTLVRDKAMAQRLATTGLIR